MGVSFLLTISIPRCIATVSVKGGCLSPNCEASRLVKGRPSGTDVILSNIVSKLCDVVVKSFMILERYDKIIRGNSGKLSSE